MNLWRGGGAGGGGGGREGMWEGKGLFRKSVAILTAHQKEKVREKVMLASIFFFVILLE